MDPPHGWNLRPVAEPVSYYDTGTRQWTSGSFDTAMKSEHPAVVSDTAASALPPPLSLRQRSMGVRPRRPMTLGTACGALEDGAERVGRGAWRDCTRDGEGRSGRGHDHGHGEEEAGVTILSVSSRRTRWTPESWPGSKLKIRFWPATTKRRGGSTGCGLSLGSERLLTRG